MRVIIAPLAFKGNLPSGQIAEAIKAGILKADEKIEAVLCPVSDGGDGFLDTFLPEMKGQRRRSAVCGALGNRVEAEWGVIPEPRTAVIELARVCGLAGIPKMKQHPLITTTYGIGELILEALDEGIRSFIIGIGGSGTNDAAAGLTQALGGRFLDSKGTELPLGGGFLKDLAAIDLSGLDSRIKESTILVGYDVINPFTGPHGASLVYASQKGANGEEIRQLEEGLQRVSGIVNEKWGIDLNNEQGTGAAGGVGGGLRAFLSARLASGIDLVLDRLDFDGMVNGADLVITGEGRLDAQTLYRKGPLRVAQRAKAKNKAVLAITGCVEEGFQTVHQHGIDAVIPLTFDPENVRIPKNTFAQIVAAAEEAVRLFRVYRNP